MKNHSLNSTVFILVFLISSFLAEAGINNINRERNWVKKLKERKLAHLRSKFDSIKTRYPEPIITIHLGASYAINNGNVQLNSGQIPGTKINLHDNLDVTQNFIAPRL